MSQESMPILSGAIPSFEMFMTSWEALKDSHSNLRPVIEAGLEVAYKYYDRMDLTKAYVVAMCKQSLFLTWQKLILISSCEPFNALVLDQEALGG